MKKYVLFCAVLFFTESTALGQDLYPGQVPSIIRNSFQNAFPKAKDIEWEKEGKDYKVEFEIGFWNDDHSARYNNEGVLVRHKEEIAQKELPQTVTSAIKQAFKWYWITDVEKITTENQVLYKVELWTFLKEWDILFDQSGKIISKSID